MILYGGLIFNVISHGRALATSAKRVSHERNQIGTEKFSADFLAFDRNLKSFSSAAGNPLFAPLFFLVGSPGSFSHSHAALASASSFTHNLLPAIKSATPQKSPTTGFNFDLISQVAPSLVNSEAQIYSVIKNMRDLHLHGLLLPFDFTLDSLRADSQSALVLSQKVLHILPAAPALLGSDGPRHYLVAFQNPAEARGTGGIIGAYAIVKAENGQLEIEHVGSNTELKSLPQLPITMPSDFINIYGQDPAIWQNSNASPHFPYAAKIWLALWKKQSGQDLDGVITLDPFVLQHYLEATGPLKVLDQSFTSENLIKQTLSIEYIRYAQDNAARKQFLVELLKATLERIVAHAPTASQLLAISEQSLSDNRVFFYSSHPQEQALISQSSIGGTLSTKDDNSYRLIINNIAGNKMEFYLNRAISISSVKCGKNPITQFDFTLENTVSPSSALPSYVNGRLDLGMPNGKGNSTSIEALVYGPHGATITGTSSSTYDIAQENGHPVFITTLEMTPKKPERIIVRFQGGVGPITNITQPLVMPAGVQIKDKCSK